VTLAVVDVVAAPLNEAGWTHEVTTERYQPGFYGRSLRCPSGVLLRIDSRAIEGASRKTTSRINEYSYTLTGL
jgi:hypothetical protein